MDQLSFVFFDVLGNDHCPDVDRFDSLLHSGLVLCSADGFGWAWHLLVFDSVYPLADFDSVSDSEDFHFVFLDYDL